MYSADARRPTDFNLTRVIAKPGLITTSARAIIFHEIMTAALIDKATQALINNPLFSNDNLEKKLLSFASTQVERDLKREIYPKFLKLLWGSELTEAQLQAIRDYYTAFILLNREGYEDYESVINMLEEEESIKSDYKRLLKALDAIIKLHPSEDNEETLNIIEQAEILRKNLLELREKYQAEKGEILDDINKYFNELLNFFNKYSSEKESNLSESIILSRVGRPINIVKNIIERCRLQHRLPSKIEASEIFKAINSVIKQNKKNTTCKEEGSRLKETLKELRKKERKLKAGNKKATKVFSHEFSTFANNNWHQSLLPDFKLPVELNNETYLDWFIHYLGFGFNALVNEKKKHGETSAYIGWLRECNMEIFSSKYKAVNKENQAEVEKVITSILSCLNAQTTFASLLDDLDALITSIDKQRKFIVAFTKELSKDDNQEEKTKLLNRALFPENYHPKEDDKNKELLVNKIKFLIDCTKESLGTTKDSNDIPLVEYFSYHPIEEVIATITQRLPKADISNYLEYPFIPKPLASAVAFAAEMLYWLNYKNNDYNTINLLRELNTLLPNIQKIIMENKFHNEVELHLHQIVPQAKFSGKFDLKRLSIYKHILAIIHLINPSILSSKSLLKDNHFKVLLANVFDRFFDFKQYNDEFNVGVDTRNLCFAGLTKSFKKVMSKSNKLDIEVSEGKGKEPKEKKKSAKKKKASLGSGIWGPRNRKRDKIIPREGVVSKSTEPRFFGAKKSSTTIMRPPAASTDSAKAAREQKYQQLRDVRSRAQQPAKMSILEQIKFLKQQEEAASSETGKGSETKTIMSTTRQGRRVFDTSGIFASSDATNLTPPAPPTNPEITEEHSSSEEGKEAQLSFLKSSNGK